MPAISGDRVRLLVIASFVSLAGVMSLSKAVPAASLPDVRLSERNAVPGCVTPRRLTDFLQSRNSRLDPRYLAVAGQYAKYGTKLGVRWDIGFFQMMVETANLAFRRPDGRPGDVAPEHNNFAGLGAIGDGRPGETFSSIAHGVRAHLEHVLHYSGAAVPAPVAERTRKVQLWRVLEEWHQGFDRPITYADLARRWAPHTDAYLASIEYLALRFQKHYCGGRPLLMVEPTERPPSVAKTAWRFERASGQLGTAGTVPPTGKPNFKSNRGALGVGRGTVAAAQSPPLPDLQKRLVSAARSQSPSPSRPQRRVQRMARMTPSKQARIPRTKQPISRARISADDRIRQMVSDRKILLRTHVGVVLPIVYNSNGRMTGSAGTLAFFLGSSRDKGRWWVKKGKLCQKWRIWLDRDIYCMQLKKRGGTIWWKADDGKSGTARIVSK